MISWLAPVPFYHRLSGTIFISLSESLLLIYLHFMPSSDHFESKSSYTHACLANNNAN